jgi:hypothetical protein
LISTLRMLESDMILRSLIFIFLSKSKGLLFNILWDFRYSKVNSGK